MLAPDPTFTPVTARQQPGVDFENRCTRQRPGPDIGATRLIAVIGRTEFSIPVIQSVKPEYGVGRLLCSGTGHMRRTRPSSVKCMEAVVQHLPF